MALLYHALRVFLPDRLFVAMGWKITYRSLDIFAFAYHTLSSAPFAPEHSLSPECFLVLALLVLALLVSALLVFADRKHNRCFDDAAQKFAQEPGMPANSTHRFAFLHRFGPPTLIVLGSLWLLQSVFAHTNSHGVLIRNLNYDAGTVKSGSIVTDNVQLINLSSQPVEVDAQPGCTCTTAILSKGQIAPLHYEVVRLQVDTVGMDRETQQEAVLLRMQTEHEAWNRLVAIGFHVM